MKLASLFFALYLLLATAGCAADLTAAEAKNHIGERATVCGTAVSVNINSSSHVTFVSLDKPYPKNIFTILITGTDLRKFIYDDPSTWKGKRVCVTGTISSFLGVPGIYVRSPGEVTKRE